MAAQPSAGSTEYYYGVFGDSVLSTNFAAGRLIGAGGRAKNTGTSTVTLGLGLSGELANTSTGIYTTGMGVYGLINNSGAGTITTAYALRGALSNTGTVTTYHGLHLDDPGTGIAANQYNIYSAGTVYNYIAGRLGIANTTPTYELDITGSLRATGVNVIFSGLNGASAGDAVCITAGNVLEEAGDGACTNPSDRRLKEDIKPIEGALDKVLALNGVSFLWKDKKQGTHRQLGLIAQDVEKVFPEVVRDRGDGFLGVKYTQLIGSLVAAIKEFHVKWSADHKQLNEQKVLLGQLERKIELENIALKAENKSLQERLDKIERALAQASPGQSLSKKGAKLAVKK
jgi:hypothetical protein